MGTDEEKGYDLPIDKQEMDEAENDCSTMMDHIYDIYNEADKGTASNVVLTEETISELQKELIETGYPIATVVTYSNMGNYYYHLSGFNVSTGNIVLAGEVIAFSGNTGNSTGLHLHLGVSIEGEYVDPMEYLNDSE